jgi:hypothetical protein
MFVYSTNKYANEQIILFQAFTQWYIFQNKNITQVHINYNSDYYDQYITFPIEYYYVIYNLK